MSNPPTNGAHTGARAYLSLGLISAAMLAFEVGLTRLFAVQQFHHFAFMVVSLALLGTAASGIALSLLRRQPTLPLLALSFAFSLMLAYALINLIPFDSYAIAWDPNQILNLIVYFAAAALPFFLAGWAAGLGLAQAGTGAHRPYAAVMIGSAFGAPLALLAHQWAGAQSVLAVALILAVSAAALLSANRLIRLVSFSIFLAAAGLFIWRPALLEPTLSDYKPLTIAQRSIGAKTGLTDWGATNRLDVIEGAATHVMPGLSPRPGVELPEQAGAYMDGDGPLPISKLDPRSEEAGLLAERMPSEAAFRLRPGARTLILEAGAGLEAQLALARGAEQVTITRDAPLILEALAGPYEQQSSGLLNHPRLHVSARTARGYLADPGETFEIVMFALTDPFRPVQSGAFSLNEDFTLTQQSFQSAFRALDIDGVLVISRWLSTPPSESARSWNTLLAALRAEGISDPADHLAAFRGLRTGTMMAFRQPLSEGELTALRQVMEENAWDPVFLPDLKPEQVNQYNVLPEPRYVRLFAELLERPERAVRQYEFRLAAPQDNQPYFFHFFRWRQTPEVVRTLGQTMQPFGGSGYLVLLVLLGLMLLLAMPLIVIPWLIARRKGVIEGIPWRLTAYFGALGAGYLLVEIPLISQLILLLERPALALGGVLFTILVGSGLGSLLVPRIRLRTALSAIIALAILTTFLLPIVIQFALPLSLPARLLITVAALLPLGIFMGVPFAAGLARVEAAKPGLIPWAWGVNGALSGISGVLAAMIAIDAGFQVVIIVGAASYAVGWLTLPESPAHSEG